MEPLTEAVTTPETIPSLAWAAARMIGAVALLAGAAWVLLRWRRRGMGAERPMRVIDRAFLARGASVALVRVAERNLLLGVS